MACHGTRDAWSMPPDPHTRLQLFFRSVAADDVSQSLVLLQVCKEHIVGKWLVCTEPNVGKRLFPFLSAS